jgi:hypothetical protein
MFFKQSLIPQLGNCQTNERGIDSRFGQDYKLIPILFVVENECNEQTAVDFSLKHDKILVTRANPEYGPSVPQGNTSVHFVQCPSASPKMDISNPRIPPLRMPSGRFLQLN